MLHELIYITLRHGFTVRHKIMLGLNLDNTKIQRKKRDESACTFN